MGGSQRWRLAERFAAVAAEMIGGIVGPTAGGAMGGIIGGGLVEGDDAGDTADLGEEEIPKAEDEGDGRDNKDGIGDDGLE